MKKILFLYTGGREKRLNEPIDSFAKEFFYGYFELKKLGYDVDFVERIIPENYKPRNPRYQWLAFHNRWATEKLIMGNNAPFFLPHLEKIKQADIIIAIGDSIALAPEYYKLRGWIKGKIIHVSMGMANYWQMAKSEGKINRFTKWYYNRLLNFADKIVLLGKPELKHFKSFFPKQRSKLVYIPFGVDTDFWNTTLSDLSEINVSSTVDILFVGNDMRRDYALLAEIPLAFPLLSFVYVTSRMNQYKLPENVTLYNGSWRGKGLSDNELKFLYNKTKIVINPIVNTLQPSGQSVTLQASACGKPVLISDIDGFWDKELYGNGGIHFVNHQKKVWIDEISKIMSEDSQRDSMAENGKKITEDNYSEKLMVKKYISLIESML